ncbi:MAG: sulfotransferase family protein [Pseudomonadota bacterium]
MSESTSGLNSGPNSGKVFCIGFQKTGTSSLRDALAQIGYRVCGVFGRDVPLNELRDSFVERGLKIAQEYDAVEDMPWPLMFRELDEAFPGSKFILTIRDTDRWYNSIANHFGANPYHIQQLTYGEDAPAPVGHEARYREVYDAHNEAVRAYFADRPDDLLEFWIERGHGWDELGAFLGRDDIPKGKFVHTNSQKQRGTVLNRIRGRLIRMGVPLKSMDG